MSHANGNGEGHHEPGDERAMQARFDRALADMPRRTQLDRLAVFTSTQINDLLKLFVSQITHLTRCLATLELEIAQLKAERHGADNGAGPKPNGGGAAQRS